MLHRIYLYITKFIYYGRIGAKTVDYDASCCHDLINAHIERVYKFMLSDKTHLVWNSSKDTKLMKRLAEFVYLSRIKKENDDFNDFYFYGKLKEELGIRPLDFLWAKQDDKEKKLIRVAFAKDRRVAESRRKRYYYLLEKYVPAFWD